MRERWISKTLGLMVASLSGLWCLAQAHAQAYYGGKTIAMSAGFSPGGSVDFEMRLAAQFLAKHIPGKPEITPMNMPGASGNYGDSAFNLPPCPSAALARVCVAVAGSPGIRGGRDEPWSTE